MGILHRKFALPIHVTLDTYQAAARYGLGEIAALCHFRSGQTLRFGKVAVETIPTPHDGADGVAFVVDDGRRRLGILTDLGHVFHGLAEILESLDAVLLESNYDPEMLTRGPYPVWLKERIRGPGGHISRTSSRPSFCRRPLQNACSGPAWRISPRTTTRRRSRCARIGGSWAGGCRSWWPGGMKPATCWKCELLPPQYQQGIVCGASSFGVLVVFFHLEYGVCRIGEAAAEQSQRFGGGGARTLGSLSLSNSMR